MRGLSSIAIFLIFNAYCAIVLTLARLAVDPEVNWAIGFFSLMGFFCFATSPCFHLIKRLAIPRSAPQRPNKPWPTGP